MTFSRSELNHLYQYCLSLCGQDADAYDLLHDALEKYLKAKTGAVETPTAYVKTIARNHFYDHQRRQKKVHFDLLEETSQEPDIERQLENTVVDALTLKAVWQTLTCAEREVMFLWAIEGQTAAEIAQQLNLPRATVLSRLHRTKIRLQANPSFASLGAHHD